MRRKRVSVRGERVFGRRLREAERGYGHLVRAQIEDCAERQPHARADDGHEFGCRAVQSAHRRPKNVVYRRPGDFLSLFVNL